MRLQSSVKLHVAQYRCNSGVLAESLSLSLLSNITSLVRRNLLRFVGEKIRRYPGVRARARECLRERANERKRKLLATRINRQNDFFRDTPVSAHLRAKKKNNPPQALVVPPRRNLFQLTPRDAPSIFPGRKAELEMAGVRFEGCADGREPAANTQQPRVTNLRPPRRKTLV